MSEEVENSMLICSQRGVALFKEACLYNNH